MKYTLPILSLLMAGCSLRTFYPTAGAILGGGSGALVAGVPGAAIGGGAGAALGQIAKGEGDVLEAKEELKALTQGDVAKLIEIRSKRDKSTFDSVIDGIYRVLWLLGVGIGLWFILPWIWAKHHVKKTVEKHINGHGQAKDNS